MIRLGLRLTVNGGKESAVRLLITALAVALGVTMLLITLAGMNGLRAQNARGAWLAVPHSSQQLVVAPETAPLLIVVNTDQYQNQYVVRVDVAATGAHAPVPPGLTRLPGPGQFDASPALAALLRTTPHSRLADRFPGTQVGLIGPAALPSPTDLVIIVGDRARTLRHTPGVAAVTTFATGAGDKGPLSFDNTGLEAILAFGALALLFPVLVFIAVATRLAAARREQRFASMRLVGATPRQVSIIAAVESFVGAVLGVAVGFLVYVVVAPLLTHVPLTGAPFAPGDLRLSAADVLVVAVGVPAASAIAARVALRKVRVSPLGVTRRVTPAPPRFYRIVPLLLGVGELAYFVGAGSPKSSNSQILDYFLGFFLIMAGLLIAGPWITMIGARAVARRARHPATLIAARRLADSPRAAFRAISGLILALFVMSASVGIISTVVTDHAAATGSVVSDTLVDQFAQNAPVSQIAAVPSSVVAALYAIKGVTGVTLVYSSPPGMTTKGPIPDVNGIGGTILASVVSCAELRRTPALGSCPRGATAVSVGPDLGFEPLTKSSSVAERTIWPAAIISSSRLRGLPVQSMAVATNGSPAVIDTAQTVLDAAFPFDSTVTLFGAISPDKQLTLAEMERMIDVVILVSLIIAGCSLAVSMTAGVSERRRPFGLLRLAGAPVSVLRRVVSLETAMPLLVIALSSASIGLLAAELFLHAQLGLTLRAPGAQYFAIVLGGLVASLGIIASTFPLLARMTRPDAVRME